jgi:hypothetical protein
MPRRSPGSDAIVPASMLWPLLCSALLVGMMMTGDVIRAYRRQRLAAQEHGTGAFGTSRGTAEPFGRQGVLATPPRSWRGMRTFPSSLPLIYLLKLPDRRQNRMRRIRLRQELTVPWHLLVPGDSLTAGDDDLDWRPAVRRRQPKPIH